MQLLASWCLTRISVDVFISVFFYFHILTITLFTVFENFSGFGVSRNWMQGLRHAQQAGSSNASAVLCDCGEKHVYGRPASVQFLTLLLVLWSSNLPYGRTCLVGSLSHHRKTILAVMVYVCWAASLTGCVVGRNSTALGLRLHSLGKPSAQCCPSPDSSSLTPQYTAVHWGFGLFWFKLGAWWTLFLILNYLYQI